MGIKTLRQKANLKQSDVASFLGVTQSAVSQWESGECQPLTGLLLDMARLYKCTADELLLALRIPN